MPDDPQHPAEQPQVPASVLGIIAAGAERIRIMMEHVTRSGELIARCTYPLTAKGCVARVYTDLAILDVAPAGFELVEMIPGLAFEDLQARTGAVVHRR
jgi:acyl CoA:acetate/3-ketoacid CoA transferase beta subunit